MLKIDFKKNSITDFFKKLSALMSSLTGLLNGLNKTNSVFVNGLKAKHSNDPRHKTEKAPKQTDRSGLAILSIIASAVLMLFAVVSAFFYFSSKIKPKQKYLNIR